MPVKNQSFNFVLDAPTDVKNSFRFSPKPILLAGGAKIIRFITLGENATDSGFWISEAVYKHFHQWSVSSGFPISQLARSRLAIKLNWSSRMDTLCVATLQRPIFGFQGPTKYQSRLDADPRFTAKGILPEPNVLLMGNFEQLWIPNLSMEDIWIDSYGPADNWKEGVAAR